MRIVNIREAIANKVEESVYEDIDNGSLPYLSLEEIDEIIYEKMRGYQDEYQD